MSTPPSHCPNCGEALGDLPRPPKFCPACGQETVVRAPRLGEFLQQFGGAYFSTEGALWRTVKLLLLKPGELTAQYLAGRRKHYVLPLRLYLTISVVVLLALRIAGANGPMKINFTPDEKAEAAAEKSKESFNLQMFGGRAGLRNGVFYCEELPAWACRKLKSRIDFSPAEMQGAVEQLRDRFVGNLGGAMFLLLPTFALWMKLVYWNRRLRYTEHLVFALHVHAFWFVALLFTLWDEPWLAGVATFGVPIYTFMAMKRVYGGRLWPRLLRGATVSLLYLIVMSVAMVGVGMVALLG